MSTARILYEQYKVLPKKVRQELKALLMSEDEPKATNSLMMPLSKVWKELRT